MKSFKLSVFIFFLVLSISSYAQSIVQLQQGKPTSIRGLSVVNDSIAWVSGSRGYIGITHNGGKNWKWQQVKGCEKADFRDIEAFSGKNAVIMSSGTPALVLKTTDGGNTWQEKYRNTDTTCFFDAMDFADEKHGFILGDPINGKFLLMETNDGGETWNAFKDAPTALQGEAAFAASGTCLRTTRNQIYIASGGTHARLITYNGSWHYAPLPITHGQASEGAFSLAIGRNNGVIAGGDYAHDKKADSLTALFSVYAGMRFTTATAQPGGFQSSVEFLKDNYFLSTGTPGSNITTDGGKNWKQIDAGSFNVCRKAKHGKLVLLAGNDGKIGMLKM